MKPANPNLQLNPEIDFVHLAKIIWQRRMLVVKLTTIAAVAGVLVAIMIPNKYTASTMIVQEIAGSEITLTDEKLLAISALASAAGTELNGLAKPRMSPQTYSTIVSSIPFRRELMHTKLNFGRSDTATSLYEYTTKSRKVQPLKRISSEINIPKVNTEKGISENQNSQTNTEVLPQLTPEESQVNKILSKQISLQVFEKVYIIIRCTLPKANAAAQLTLRTEQLLQRYLTEIQTGKVRQNVKFIQENHDKAKENFLKIQENLVALREGKNPSRILGLKSGESEKSEEIRLSADCRVAENAYSDLVKKLQQSKIALSEQTPLFKIIEPITVPTEKSSPNRIKIIAFFAFFGFVLAIVLIIGNGFIKDTMEKWRKY